MIIVNLLLIQFIVVSIIDISGFIGEIEGILAKWLNIRSAKRAINQEQNTQETSVPADTQKVQKVIKAQNTYVKFSIPKPFSCSYCSTWWIGLLYLILTGNLTLYYVAALLFICSLTTITQELIYLTQDILIKLTTTIRKIIN